MESVEETQVVEGAVESVAPESPVTETIQPETVETQPSEETTETTESADVYDPFGSETDDMYEKMRERVGDRSFSLKPEDIESADELVKKQLYNMKRAYNMKTDKLAEQRREQESRAAELKQQALALEEEKRQLYSLFGSDEFNKLVNPDAPEAVPDPWTEEGIAYRAEQGAADFMKKIQSHILQKDQEVQAKLQRHQQLTAIETFAKEHPDFDEKLPQIKQLKSERGIGWEDAYWRIKGQEAAQKRATNHAVRSRGASLSSKPGRSEQRRAHEIPKDVLNGTAQEKLEWLKANPEAHQRLYSKIAK